MTLDYKILWIDDQPNSIISNKETLCEYLEEDLGFKCEIAPVESYQEFKDKYGDTSFLKNFDLVLVDFKLDEIDKSDIAHSGFNILQDIRNLKVYTEVVFYSSKYDDLVNTIKNHPNHIEGIFTASRDDFNEKVQSIIDVSIQKVQDINNLRGLIMAEVSELDVLKEEIINLASQKVPDKELEKYTLEKIKSSGESNHKKAKKHLENLSSVTFTSLFSNIGFVDSNKKAMTIGEALEKLKITEPVTKTTFTDPYIENILKKRNKFAHIKECERDDGNGKQCKFIDDIPFTEEKCIEIRKEIKQYKKLLEDIKNAI